MDIATHPKFGDIFTAAFDHEQGLIYVTGANGYIHVISLATSIHAPTTVTTIAGDGHKGFADGVGLQARFLLPSGICLYNQKKTLLVCDFGNHRIRAVELTSSSIYIDKMKMVDALGIMPLDILFLIVSFLGQHNVSTWAGDGTDKCEDGPGIKAKVGWASQITASDVDNYAFFTSEGYYPCVRSIDPNGYVKTIAGMGTGARFAAPCGITIDSMQRVIVADPLDSNRIGILTRSTDQGCDDWTVTSVYVKSQNVCLGRNQFFIVNINGVDYLACNGNTLVNLNTGHHHFVCARTARSIFLGVSLLTPFLTPPKVSSVAVTIPRVPLFFIFSADDKFGVERHDHIWAKLVSVSHVKDDEPK